MPVHNKVEIERQAQELLDSKLGADFEIPVDLVELLERMGGELEVRFEGSKDPESLLVEPDGSFTVFVPSNTSRARDRFTIAHEIGHYVLHWERDGQIATFQRYGRTPAEFEANAFAGALLMPHAHFTQAWEAHLGNLRLIARQFDVSQSAAGVRQQVLGL